MGSPPNMPTFHQRIGSPPPGSYLYGTVKCIAMQSALIYFYISFLQIVVSKIYILINRFLSVVSVI
jgi:hypothetical protein